MGYEQLLMPSLLSSESILRGIRRGVLPPLGDGGWTLAEYVEILQSMGRYALEGNAETWIWREISKKSRAKL